MTSPRARLGSTEASDGGSRLDVPGVVLEILIFLAWLLLVDGHEVAGASVAFALLAHQVALALGARRASEDDLARHDARWGESPGCAGKKGTGTSSSVSGTIKMNDRRSKMKRKLVLTRETVRALARRDLATIAAGDAAVDGITRGSRCDPPPPPD